MRDDHRAKRSKPVNPSGAVLEFKLDTDWRKRPLLHLLQSSTTDLGIMRAITVAVPECPADDAESHVYAVLINGKGEPYRSETEPFIVVESLPLTLQSIFDPEALLRPEQLAAKAGVSIATIKREVQRGNLAKPVRISTHAVGHRMQDVQDWMAKTPGIAGGKRAAAKAKR